MSVGTALFRNRAVAPLVTPIPAVVVLCTLPTWAARCNTWLLSKLTPKGVPFISSPLLFFSFLFLSFLFAFIFFSCFLFSVLILYTSICMTVPASGVYTLRFYPSKLPMLLHMVLSNNVSNVLVITQHLAVRAKLIILFEVIKSCCSYTSPPP